MESTMEDLYGIIVMFESPNQTESYEILRISDKTSKVLLADVLHLV